MDPLTAILNLINSLTELVKEIVKNQPPSVAAELWNLYLEDIKKWREFLDRFHPEQK